MNKQIFSWCLYDWANSAFPTVITTFIFATYFTQGIAPNEVEGTSTWGTAMAIAGLSVAVLAPVIGAIADQGGRRKPWLAFFTALCVIGSAALWFAEPSPEFIPWALAWVVVSTIGFEFGMVFYNAMLPGLTTEDRMGRVSGWGWGIGYIGGLGALVLCLLGFVQTDSPLFGVSKEEAGHIRATVIVVALWLAVFSLPLFLFTPDRGSRNVSAGTAIREGLSSLGGTLRRIRQYRDVFRFLIARMFYADGMTTLLAFGGIYAAGTFNMEFAEVIQFGIALNVTAGIGAVVFGWADDRFGAKQVIIVNLIALLVLSVAALMVESKSAFWAVGLALGVFIGPTQAASRTMMARLSPRELQTEFFGLYALSGKATAFLGPLILGWVTLSFDSQRAGMATILAFFLIGLVLLLAVRAPKPEDRQRDETATVFD